jgi:alpha-glucosidase (family GH31 glycosyl hydrolase)
MPYIYDQAKKCTETGLPMMRALYLEFPEDRNVWQIQDEYLFGSQLLIAPVLKPMKVSKIRSVYLPRGTWYDYFTKEKIVSAGEWIQRTVQLKTLPIFVKARTVLQYCGADKTLADGMGNIVKTETWDDTTE